MDPILKKLQYKGQPEVFVLKAPASFEPQIKSFSEQANVYRQLDDVREMDYFVVFLTKKEEIDHLTPQIAPLLKGDAVCWMCYPKGSSKKYTCDFNRDTGWEIMKKYDLVGVSQVAIDEDWSALRFRRREYIKTLTRKFDTH
ncbi:MAG: hypothetical protein V2I46_08765 [Bacteroides sp.]|nr:hypothetical protein [Bacteroides sp.]